MNDFLPAHTDAEREHLKSDIKANGIQVPVVIDEHGKIIDGRLRAEIADEMKLSWKKGADVRLGLSEAEKHALRIRLNLLRRSTPPTQKQQREHRSILLMAHPEMSDQVIAEMCGASRSTVQRDRKQLAKAGKLLKAVATVGKDGKRRRVNSKPRVIVSSDAEFKKAAKDWKTISELEGEAPTGLTSMKRLGRKANSALRKSRREGTPVESLPDNVQLHHCDFRELDIEPGAVDLVLTDVLWTKDAIPEWKVLTELAKKWLKPEGLFATYIGTFHLAKLIQQIEAGGLHYQWVFPVMFPENGQSCHELVGVTAMWRPVVAFSVTQGPHDFGGLLDVFRAGKPEKEWHEYQQSLESTKSLVEQLSKPGDLVADACMGTGTTALACMTADGGPRRFAGCDRDEDMCKSARMRIDEYLRTAKEAA